MELTRGERVAIKQLLQDPKWQFIERVARLIQEKIRLDSKVRDTEWETLKTVLVEEGKDQGISKLIQELYAIAQSNDQ